jgi:hypothetical protein
MNNKYEEYAIIDAKIKALTDQKNALRVSMLEEMVSTGELKKVTTIGTFSVNKLKSWTMPSYIDEMEEDFKAAVEKAKSVGDATFVENDSLKFTPIKL